MAYTVALRHYKHMMPFDLYIYLYIYRYTIQHQCVGRCIASMR